MNYKETAADNQKEYLKNLTLTRNINDKRT